MKKILLLIFLPLSVFSQVDTCDVEFIFNVNSESRQVSFIQKNQEVVINTYLWNFGDGETSTMEAPTHVYDQTGSFIVCLTVMTSNGCIGNYCDTVIIETLPQIIYNLSGTVVTNLSELPHGFALLIKQNYNEYTYTEVAPVIDGFYHFYDIDPGVYLVQIIPVFNVSGMYFPFYLPTYSGNVVNWQQASQVQVYSNNAIENIHLASFNSIITGDRDIKGKISYTSNAEYEENIFNMNWMNHMQAPNPDRNASNIPVLLYNVDGMCIKSAQTDSMGRFLFSNIPYGKYFVSPEKAGQMSQGIQVDIETMSDSLNFYYITLNSQGFVNVQETFMESETVVVYPNPAKNSIFIPDEITGPFNLYSCQGEIIGSYPAGTGRVDLSLIQSGLYFIRWQSGESTFFVKQ